jgi:hypothetical protein
MRHLIGSVAFRSPVLVAAISLCSAVQAQMMQTPFASQYAGIPSSTYNRTTAGASVCSGSYDAFGDGCPATQATLAYPRGMVADSFGNVYIAEVTNHQFRVVYQGGTALSAALVAANPGLTFTPTPGYIYGLGAAAASLITAYNPSLTAPQVGYVYALSNPTGTATTTDFVDATSIAVDSNEDVYVADAGSMMTGVTGTLGAMACQGSHAASKSGGRDSAFSVGKITPGPSHPLAPGFLGANIENAYNLTNTYHWGDPETVAAVKEMGIQRLRYPSGTAANYWNWQAGWVDSNFLTKSGPFYDDTLANFAPLAKTTGAPLFVLNVMTYNNAIGNSSQNDAMIQNQIVMLNAAKQLGMPIQSIELGNEFYLGMDHQDKDAKYYAQRFPSATAYANDMNYWIKELKAAFPQVEIAAVGQGYQGGSWNADILSKLVGEDAITLHQYERVKTPEDPVALLSMVFSHWASFRADEIQPVIEKKKSVWMTEFDFIDDTPDMEYASTWLHGLCDAEMLLQYLSEPAVTQVEIYNFHSWSRRSSLIYDGTEGFGPQRIVKTEAGAVSASGHVMSLFGKALNGASSVAPLNFSNSVGAETTSKSFPAVTGVALSYGATGHKGFIVVNLCSRPSTMSYNGGKAQMESIFAPSLSANIVTKDALEPVTRQISLKQFTVPPYSVNYIQW